MLEELFAPVDLGVLDIDGARRRVGCGVYFAVWPNVRRAAWGMTQERISPLLGDGFSTMVGPETWDRLESLVRRGGRDA